LQGWRRLILLLGGPPLLLELLLHLLGAALGGPAKEFGNLVGHRNFAWERLRSISFAWASPC
jgi:hypothetical protein